MIYEEKSSQMGYIFGSVFTLSNRLQVLGDKLDKKLTVKQWLLLAAILKSDSKEPTISEVAIIIGSSRQNVKKTLLILERQGFVLIRKDRNDARMQRIRLTEQCLLHLKAREEQENHFLSEVFRGFSKNELSGFRGVIDKLGNNIKGMEQKYETMEKG